MIIKDGEVSDQSGEDSVDEVGSESRCEEIVFIRPLSWRFSGSLESVREACGALESRTARLGMKLGAAALSIVFSLLRRRDLRASTELFTRGRDHPRCPAAGRKFCITSDGLQVR